MRSHVAGSVLPPSNLVHPVSDLLLGQTFAKTDSWLQVIFSRRPSQKIEHITNEMERDIICGKGSSSFPDDFATLPATLTLSNLCPFQMFTAEMCIQCTHSVAQTPFIRTQPLPLARWTTRPFPPEHIIYIFLDEELMCFHSIATLIHFCVCSVCSLGEDRVAKFMYFLFPTLFLPSLPVMPSLPYRAFASSGLRDEREQQRHSLLSPPFCVVSLVDYNYVGCGSIGFAFHPLKLSLDFQPCPTRPFTSVWSSLVSIQRHANIPSLPPSQLPTINS